MTHSSENLDVAAGDSALRTDHGSAADHRTSDEEAQRALNQGDKEKIDKVLAEQDVSTTEAGSDQTQKPDTEGSNSSSKNLDEQGE